MAPLPLSLPSPPLLLAQLPLVPLLVVPPVALLVVALPVAVAKAPVALVVVVRPSTSLLTSQRCRPSLRRPNWNRTASSPLLRACRNVFVRSRPTPLLLYCVTFS